MLAVSIKLDHIVVVMVDGISSRSLKAHSQTTIDWHANDVAAKFLTDGKRAIVRPIVNNNKIKAWRNLP